MPLYVGTQRVAELYRGATPIARAYKGATEVFSAGISDPHFADVELLLHFDDADGTTTVIDSSSSPKTVTTNGNAQIDTAQSKFGGSSALFDGSGDWFSLADSATWRLAGDFTVELFYRPANLSAFRNIVGAAIAGGKNGWGLTTTNVGQWAMLTGNGSTITVTNSSISPTLNVWQHIALVRSGSTVTFYVDGEVGGSVSNSSFGAGNFPLRVGNAWGISGGNWSNQTPSLGHIDELRITHGVARYTAAFTPPTQAFPNQ